MIHAKPSPTPRPGFTLVELMVSMALILFIMAILSQAFVVGMDTFRDMKGIGDMEERLRSATQILRRDLAADHFEGRRRLSDLQFWDTPVREGFFKIDQWSEPWLPPYPPLPGPTPPESYLEGTDPDLIASYRAPNNVDASTNQLITDPATLLKRSTRLHFTSKLRGNEQDRYFSASGIPPTSPLFDPTRPTNFFGQAGDGRFQEGDGYSTPWAEITYHLKHTGQAGATPLYALYRSQLAVVPDNRALNWPTLPATPIPFNGVNVVGHQELCWLGFPFSLFPPYQSLFFLNPSDLAGTTTTPPLRASLQGYPNSVMSMPPTPPERASTLLLTDVISFNVRLLKYRPLATPAFLESDFQDADFFTVTRGPNVIISPRVFDTNPYQFEIIYPPSQNYVTNAVPLMKNNIIKALQISIRVWDGKTQQARQVTIVQEM